MIEGLILAGAFTVAGALFGLAYRNLKRWRFQQLDQLDDELGESVPPWDDGSGYFSDDDAPTWPDPGSAYPR